MKQSERKALRLVHRKGADASETGAVAQGLNPWVQQGPCLSLPSRKAAYCRLVQQHTSSRLICILRSNIALKLNA